MLISGVQKFTQLDFPEHLACIVFTAGCPFRCGYCHNPEFVLPERIAQLRDAFIPREAFLAFLKTRQGLIDGVVVTGGEPTMARDLPEFLREVRALGFKTKLDTNGYNPDMLCQVIGEDLVDYIAMDLKADADTYARTVGVPVDMKKIKTSIAAIMQSGVPYEFRSTLIKELHTEEVVKNMAALLDGATRWYLQEFRSQHVLDPQFEKFHSYSRSDLEGLAKLLDTTIVQVR